MHKRYEEIYTILYEEYLSDHFSRRRYFFPMPIDYIQSMGHGVRSCFLHCKIIKGYRDIKEIPKSQRYADRLRLDALFSEGIIKDKAKRNRVAKEAFEKYGYTQKEVADFIGIHYSVVSRLLKK